MDGGGYNLLLLFRCDVVVCLLLVLCCSPVLVDYGVVVEFLVPLGRCQVVRGKDFLHFRWWSSWWCMVQLFAVFFWWFVLVAGCFCWWMVVYHGVLLDP